MMSKLKKKLTLLLCFVATPSILFIPSATSNVAQQKVNINFKSTTTYEIPKQLSSSSSVSSTSNPSSDATSDEAKNQDDKQEPGSKITIIIIAILAGLTPVIALIIYYLVRVKKPK